MLEIDDTDNPEKESFRRDPSGRFGRREAGCERVTRVLVANEPRSYRQAIAAALQVIRPDMEVLVVEPELLDDEVEEQPEHERAEEPRQRGRRLLATPHLLRVRGSIPGADGGSLPSPTRLRLPDHKTTNFA